MDIEMQQHFKRSAELLKQTKVMRKCLAPDGRIHEAFSQMTKLLELALVYLEIHPIFIQPTRVNMKALKSKMKKHIKEEKKDIKRDKKLLKEDKAMSKMMKKGKC